MPISVVASKTQASADGSTLTTSPGVDTTGADGIVLCVSCFTSSVVTGVTDNKGPNTYTPLTGKDADSGSSRIRMFYCAAPNVGSGHTWTTVGGAFMAIVVIALSSTSAGAFYDGVESVNGSGTPGGPGSITPTEDDCIVVAALAYSSTATPYTIDGGFTIVGQLPLGPGMNFGVGLAYLIQTAAAAANPTWSGSATFAANAIAAFRSGGGPPPPSNSFSAANIAVL